MFFYEDMKVPKVKSTFGVWNIKGTRHYVCDGNDSKHTYIYTETSLKYVATFSQSNVDKKRGIWTAKIQRANAKGLLCHGDHITFGIIRKRNGDTILKTHKRIYVDVTGNYEFQKEVNSPECNFTLDASIALSNLADFSKTKCETFSGQTLTDSVNSQYKNSTDDLMIIFEMCKAIVSGLVVPGGGTRLCYMHGKRRKIHTCPEGRKEYVTLQGHRKYLQNGGAYKTVSFMTDVFVEFLSKHILQKVQDVRPALLSVKIIFDENNELSASGNKYIAFIYNFAEDLRQYFYLDSKMALIACYAEQVIQSNQQSTLSTLEMSCYNQFMNMPVPSQGIQPL